MGAGLLILLALIYQYGYLLTGEKAGMQNETSTESQPSTTSSSSPEPSSSDYTSQTAVSGRIIASNMNSEFVNINPNNGVTMPDMLQAGIHNGLDTVGQTLKNSSLDLRGDVTIPKSMLDYVMLMLAQLNQTKQEESLKLDVA